MPVAKRDFGDGDYVDNDDDDDDDDKDYDISFYANDIIQLNNWL